MYPPGAIPRMNRASGLRCGNRRQAETYVGKIRMMVLSRFAAIVAVTLGGILGAAAAHADGTVGDPQNAGQLDQPFFGYLAGNGFGYLDAQRVLSDGAVACVNDQHGVPVDLIISMLTARAYTPQEAQAIVAAMQKADHTDGFAPLC